MPFFRALFIRGFKNKKANSSYQQTWSMDGAAVGVAVIPVLAVSMTLAKMATTCQ